MNAPVLFCHYGNSPYLKYTLHCARVHNPDKEVILLGDETNEQVAHVCGCTHRFFSDFNHEKETDQFDRVFRYIVGSKVRPSHQWVKFVFKRWFYVHSYIEEKGLGQFWHFDSDTMILDSLAIHESKFREYDNTEQCDGKCINGFILNVHVVKGYIQKINELFQREEYLKAQQHEIEEQNPLFSFTEMRAYVKYREEEHFKSIRLNTILNGSSFDDVLWHSHGMEMEAFPDGREIKKVYLNKDGCFYCLEIISRRFIRMNSLNLSNLPLWYFYHVLEHSLKRIDQPIPFCEPDPMKTRTLAAMPKPFSFLVRNQLPKIRRHVMEFAGSIRNRVKLL